MVRPGLRRSEIDWENVDIHISREEMEREQEHEAAIQQAKQYLIKNFPKFCTINNGYYETETFNHDAGMYEVMHVDHIVIGDQAIYVIKTVQFHHQSDQFDLSDIICFKPLMPDLENLIFRITCNIMDHNIRVFQ
jgi:hypothetical protein